MAMTLRDEYKREVFASWFDLRQVLADRRKLIFMPENTFEDDETELANSPFKFAVKSVVLPAAVLGFLATVPSTVMEMPPTPAERRIASLQAQADSTEESSRESLSNLDSATIQRAERSEVDSLRARHRARLESLASIAPDSAELRVSIEAVLTRLDSLRNRYQRQVEPLLDQMDSVRAHVEESSLARDSVRTILSEYMDIRAEFGRNTSREYAKAESLNSEYERLAAIQSLQVQQLDSISDYQTYQPESCTAHRSVAIWGVIDEPLVGGFRIGGCDASIRSISGGWAAS